MDNKDELHSGFIHCDDEFDIIEERHDFTDFNPPKKPPKADEVDITKELAMLGISDETPERFSLKGTLATGFHRAPPLTVIRGGLK